MAILSLNRIAWTYTSDDGNSYRVAAQKAVTDQAKLGGVAGAGVLVPLPFVYRMRRITVRNAAQNFSRVVHVYATDAAILTAGQTVNLNHLADSYTFTSDGGPTLIGENRPRHSVTKQAT